MSRVYGIRWWFILVGALLLACNFSTMGQMLRVEAPAVDMRIVLLPDVADYTPDDLQAAAQVVSRRLAGLGLDNASVQVSGSRIIVDMQTALDIDLVTAAIQQRGLLELVDFSGLRAEAQTWIGRAIWTTEQARLQPTLPDGAALHPLMNQPFVTILTGASFQAASASLDSSGRWGVQFELTPAAGQIFEQFTGSHLGEAVAIVLDGAVLSAPIIQAALSTGGVITGNFTEDEARTLALQLRSGALPVPLVVESVITP